jgi:molecular chaperone Hsp33
MKDGLQRFLFEDASVRGELVHLNHSFQTIMQKHNYPPLIQRLLGEALVIVSLLSAIIKFNGRLTVQFQSKNKLKLLLAQCNNNFEIRGLAQWEGELDEGDLYNTLEQGLLVIIMDPDENGKRYQGIVSWQGNSLAECIEKYFRDSEQLPTKIWLAVNEIQATGLLLQVIPREGDKHYKSSPVATDDDWERITILTSTITPNELLTLDNEIILRRLYSQESVRVFAPTAISFHCNCTAVRCENAIQLLGKEEAEQELAEKQSIVVTCEFCNHEYVFDRIDVERIFKGGIPPTSTQVH